MIGVELVKLLRRPRTWISVVLTCALPFMVAVFITVTHLVPPPGQGSAFLSAVLQDGALYPAAALALVLPVFLPVAVAVVAGDSIAGEAGYGTLRYLLAVPAGRTRLLIVKYATIVVWCAAAVFIVSAIALVVGVVLFPVGPVTLLSGDTVSLGAGLVRVLLVTLYICAAMAAIGAVGLAISTFTEHAIGAIAAVMILVVASEVVDNIPQFATVAPYLPTHWWNSFDALLRTPVDTTTLGHGLLSFAVYAVLFFLIAWARFTSSDVTS